jgi:hypothetical protein
VRGSPPRKESTASGATLTEDMGPSPAALRLTLVALAALTGAAGSSASAAEPSDELRVYKPVADTYVTAARGRTNFGRSRVLRVDASPETTAFLRFRLKQPEDPAESITLLLRPTSLGRARYAVRQVENDQWRERRLTYATAPHPSMRFVSSRPVRRGAWSAVDVTAFVQPDGGEEVTLAITTHGTRAIAFGSRESRSGPRLVVRTDDGEQDDVLDAILRH